jgi:hypothetical protein
VWGVEGKGRGRGGGEDRMKKREEAIIQGSPKRIKYYKSTFNIKMEYLKR